MNKKPSSFVLFISLLFSAMAPAITLEEACGREESITLVSNGIRVANLRIKAHDEMFSIEDLNTAEAPRFLSAWNDRQTTRFMPHEQDWELFQIHWNNEAGGYTIVSSHFTYLKLTPQGMFEQEDFSEHPPTFLFVEAPSVDTAGRPKKLRPFILTASRENYKARISKVLDTYLRRQVVGDLATCNTTYERRKTTYPLDLKNDAPPLDFLTIKELYDAQFQENGNETLAFLTLGYLRSLRSEYHENEMRICVCSGFAHNILHSFVTIAEILHTFPDRRQLRYWSPGSGRGLPDFVNISALTRLGYSIDVYLCDPIFKERNEFMYFIRLLRHEYEDLGVSGGRINPLDQTHEILADYFSYPRGNFPSVIVDTNASAERVIEQAEATARQYNKQLVVSILKERTMDVGSDLRCIDRKEQARREREKALRKDLKATAKQANCDAKFELYRRFPNIQFEPDGSFYFSNSTPGN